MDNIVEKQLEELEFHKIASMHRDMNQLEYEALKEDIRLNGQLVPIYIYRGKIVDGRHRYKALYELNEDIIKCIEIPRNTTIETVKEIVMSTENRRTDTPAQKTIRAYYWMQEDLNRTRKEAAEKFGVQGSEISRVKKIVEMVGSKIINDLFNKGYCIINAKRFTNLKTLETNLKKALKPKNDKTSVAKIEMIEEVKDVLDVLKQLKQKDDVLSLAQIEAYAKKLRMSE